MKPIKFAVNAKDDSAEFYVYDVIGADFWGEGVTVKALVEALKATKGTKNLTVRINSPGGDVFEGQAILNQLNTSGRHITVHVDGLAASAASVIAMAGDEIKIAAGGQIMIHNAWTGQTGDAEEHRKIADVLDVVSSQIAAIYAARTGKPQAEMQALMDAETWMTAEQALELGFATSITEAKRMAAFVDRSLFKYKNCPKEFLNQAEAQPITSPEQTLADQYRAKIAKLREPKSDQA